MTQAMVTSEIARDRHKASAGLRGGAFLFVPSRSARRFLARGPDER